MKMKVERAEKILEIFMDGCNHNIYDAIETVLCVCHSQKPREGHIIYTKLGKYLCSDVIQNF